MLLNLGFNSLRWDELVHCLGGWQLLSGHFMEYLTTNTFYPPMFNAAVAAYFGLGGVGVFCARLVAVTFSVLSLIVLFELAERVYGSRVALLAVVFFGVMPGVVWASRLAFIETMLEFFFLVSLFFFFNWLRTDRNRDLLLGGFALGLGFLVKYQALVAGLVMLAALGVFGWRYFKLKVTRFSLMLLIAFLIVVVWFVLTCVYAPATLNQWVYAISVGDQKRIWYANRIPVPFFYFVEMTWPYADQHPISLFLYVLGFAGLGLMAWRRKPWDKVLIIWFIIIYVVFTLIGNRQWRYVMPLFPVLAISASSLVMSFVGNARGSWKSAMTRPRKNLYKVAAALLIAFTATATIISCADAYHWVTWEEVNVPVNEAVNYVAKRLEPNQTILLACTYELFSGGMASFYLRVNNKQTTVFQYPTLPTDTFTTNFNISELISICQQNNVRYVLLSEHHWTATYFNSTLTPYDIGVMIYDSGRFCNQMSVGIEPDRIFILTFD